MNHFDEIVCFAPYKARIESRRWRHDYLSISKKPLITHSAYRLLKDIYDNSYSTKKEIRFACRTHVAVHVTQYWTELRRKGYIWAWRIPGNQFVYEVSDLGMKFMADAELNYKNKERKRKI